MTDSDASTGMASETTTLSGRHDSITSPRSSLCSSSTDSININPSAKPAKRVRFEESVNWSYFDVNPDNVPPALQRKPSFLGRSWLRFKTRNSSVESDLGSSPATSTNLQHLKSRNFSVDLLEMDAKAARRLPGAPARSLSNTYSVQQPLRQTAGRKYSGAETAACWKPNTPTQKGDWNDLLGSAGPHDRLIV